MLTLDTNDDAFRLGGTPIGNVMRTYSLILISRLRILGFPLIQYFFMLLESKLHAITMAIHGCMLHLTGKSAQPNCAFHVSWASFTSFFWTWFELNAVFNKSCTREPIINTLTPSLSPDSVRVLSSCNWPGSFQISSSPANHQQNFSCLCTAIFELLLELVSWFPGIPWVDEWWFQRRWVARQTFLCQRRLWIGFPWHSSVSESAACLLIRWQWGFRRCGKLTEWNRNSRLVLQMWLYATIRKGNGPTIFERYLRQMIPHHERNMEYSILFIIHASINVHAKPFARVPNLVLHHYPRKTRKIMRFLFFFNSTTCRLHLNFQFV